jgi:hypothetical protein
MCPFDILNSRVFTTTNITTHPILDDCRKGECGTCEVMSDGKWIRTCVTKVASPMQINIRAAKVKSKKASGFFSPQSFVDGFTANALGMVGLVTEGAKEVNECSDKCKHCQRQ